MTTYRVIHKDRKFVDELNYKGWNVRLADWVHLSNPDDPSRPIIAQVFRCWVSVEPYVSEVLYLRSILKYHRSKKGQQGLTVSWYYRPEQVCKGLLKGGLVYSKGTQTFHSADRNFWEGEVFKTSTLCFFLTMVEEYGCYFCQVTSPTTPWKISLRR